MAELPSGTVSLLFSDIEGSTVLLSRLGPSYSDALDGQRRVLRRAWAEHGGTELGTEGDSFMVVFTTAEDAVAAAAQAQRELAGFDWPGGEQVRVRMGIHTGSPTVHDSSYVGMDVHRAARIAGAAHGGQVVVSSTTAELVAAGLPEQVGLRDLGRHHLKDIPQPEHLFQLIIGGLSGDFPPLKTLGAASSLPRPATPLVGRDGELAELEALLGSPVVRMVTLTGPGGSGKTRLAIAVAQEVVERFPDGMYFVPLAAVTTAEVMWTSIAQVLDVPPDARTPAGLLTHVENRSALLVLDNLEQVADADEVVAQVLDRAGKAVVLTTSRRVLSVPGEYVYPVPPLELPDADTAEVAAQSGAVQLFVKQAQMVRPSFALTHGNAADVSAICRRLDGLPLAIELAAARVRLLSPMALLARLDQALDIAATGKQRPSRQKTLRDTISWSYDLLTAKQQAFFRRLGVFAGGADLAAVKAVTSDILDDADPLDRVAELVDASLAVITDGVDGEPRVAMLETVGSYARGQLETKGELDLARQHHTDHFAIVAEHLNRLLKGEGFFEARSQLETEHDNFREALDWTLAAQGLSDPTRDAVRTALRLCLSLSHFWELSGYLSEARRWLERAIESAGESDSPELAECLTWQSNMLQLTGDFDAAYPYSTASVSMWRRLGDKSRPACQALERLARLEYLRGQTETARALYQEAETLARASTDKATLHDLLANFSIVEHSEGNYQRSLELNTEVLALAHQLGSRRLALIARYNRAGILRVSGQVAEAAQDLAILIPDLLEFNNVTLTMALAEDYAASLAELGDYHHAVQLFGAADAMRQRQGAPRDPLQQAELDEPIGKTRAALTDEEWEVAYQAGRGTTVEDALTEVHAEAVSSSP
jgi:predicted ATPase/class 3 adenylate cyclase